MVIGVNCTSVSSVFFWWSAHGSISSQSDPDGDSDSDSDYDNGGDAIRVIRVIRVIWRFVPFVFSFCRSVRSVC